MIYSQPSSLDSLDHALDHVGILSKNIETSIKVLSPILGVVAVSDLIIDPIQDVKAIFAKTNQGLVLEFLEPNSDTSPITNSLAKNNNLIHHLAYRTNDLEKSTEAIREIGGMPIGKENEGNAFDNAFIQFFLLPDGWLIELIAQSKSTMKFPNILNK